MSSVFAEATPRPGPPSPRGPQRRSADGVEEGSPLGVVEIHLNPKAFQRPGFKDEL
jgi:hypothetical protein